MGGNTHVFHWIHINISGDCYNFAEGVTGLTIFGVHQNYTDLGIPYNTWSQPRNLWRRICRLLFLWVCSPTSNRMLGRVGLCWIFPKVAWFVPLRLMRSRWTITGCCLWSRSSHHRSHSHFMVDSWTEPILSLIMLMARGSLWQTHRNPYRNSSHVWMIPGVNYRANEANHIQEYSFQKYVLLDIYDLHKYLIFLMLKGVWGL